ncbi:MAG: hypothetical protein AAF657_29455 [Acidobacteriota bacterium]
MSLNCQILKTFILLSIAIVGGGAALAAPPTLLEPDFPSLELEPGQTPYKAAVDLGGYEWPLINVTNPSDAHYAMVRVVAWSAATGKSRWYLISLEPRGSSTLSLEGGERFAHLSLVGKQVFRVELLSADDDRRHEVSVTRELDLPTKSSTTCDCTWTLTCDSGGCSGLGPFSASGRVEDDDKVYWNQNAPLDPHQAWKTENGDEFGATWSASGPGSCPYSVVNDLGHVYDVDVPCAGGGGGNECEGENPPPCCFEECEFENCCDN